MTEHDVKCWPEFYPAIESGEKTFELRVDDRHYQIGDTMLIREWDPDTKEYSGRQSCRLITYKMAYEKHLRCAAHFGLNPGYAILSIAPMPLQDHATKNEAKPEWMTDPKRLPMIESSLRTRCEEMRKSAWQARGAYKKEYFGAPWTWFADTLDEGAATLEARLATLLAEEQTEKQS